jgi:hypothetical protein
VQGHLRHAGSDHTLPLHNENLDEMIAVGVHPTSWTLFPLAIVFTTCRNAKCLLRLQSYSPNGVAELIAIRVSQVAMLDRPSKVCR